MKQTLMAWGSEIGEQDYHPTPEWATAALLRALPPPKPRRDSVVVEPCAGGGAIVRMLLEHGYNVWANELRAREEPELVGLLGSDNVRIGSWFGVAPCELPSWTTALVTNPPFSQLPDFAARCLRLGIPYVALLLPVGILFGQANWDFNARFRPTGMVRLMRRPFPTVRDCAWLVWEHGKTPLAMEMAR
jgi:hypothetical protein